MNNTSTIHWNYLLALEQDLSSISKYIELCPDNFKCYSTELARVLLSTASEVDVVAKALIAKIDPSQSVESNIEQYRKALMTLIPSICNFKVLIPRYDLVFEPWSSWINDSTPEWWKSYNSVKHERNNNYQKANLENALNAFSGLLVLLLHLYREEVEHGHLMPLTLFKPDLEGVLIKSNINPGMTGVRYRFPK